MLRPQTHTWQALTRQWNFLRDGCSSQEATLCTPSTLCCTHDTLCGTPSTLRSTPPSTLWSTPATPHYSHSGGGLGRQRAASSGLVAAGAQPLGGPYGRSGPAGPRWPIRACTSRAGSPARLLPHPTGPPRAPPSLEAPPIPQRSNVLATPRGSSPAQIAFLCGPLDSPQRGGSAGAEKPRAPTVFGRFQPLTVLPGAWRKRPGLPSPPAPRECCLAHRACLSPPFAHQNAFHG